MLPIEKDLAIESELKALADMFTDRLSKTLLEDIKIDIECREWEVAFDSLCQHLYELNIPITDIELDKIKHATNSLLLFDYNLAPMKDLIDIEA